MSLIGGRRRKSRRRRSRKAGKSPKVGSKGNPYKNKTAAAKGNRKGKIYYKKKGTKRVMKK
jgi:hypothetical protein